MYKRIVVALDGSETAQRALRSAVGLAAGLRARLRLVYVVDELGANLGPTYTPEDFWKAARSAGERILRNASARVTKAGVQPETRLLENRTFGAVGRRVAELIVADAEASPADLIVIGTHGRRGLSKVVFGSVAEGVLRASDIPVLLIRGVEIKAPRALAVKSSA
jgi:nucleotide-binding universal stress UspA family protein